MKKITLNNAIILSLVLFYSCSSKNPVDSNNSSLWTKVMLDNNATVFAVSGDNLFVGTGYSGVFLSTNNGTNWTAINNGFQKRDSIFYPGVKDLTLIGTTIFASTDNGIYRSTNNGTNWDNVGPNWGGGYLAVNGDSICSASNSAFILSTNNGESWKIVKSNLPFAYVNDFVISNTQYILGTSNGIFISKDGGTNWIESNTGLTNTWVISLLANDNKIFAGSIGGVYYSSNNGTSWVGANTGLTYDVKTFAGYGAKVFAGGWRGGVFLSTNNGENWTQFNTGMTDTLVNSLIVSGSNLFAGVTWYGVWRHPL